VYSCSGCSNVAQLANTVAVRLDRAGLAEMSCIVGVGGGVQPLLRKAGSGRPIIVIDGCPLACCETVLGTQGLTPDRLVKLHERGLRKRYGTDFAPDDRDRIYEELVAELAPLLGARTPDADPGGSSTQRVEKGER
jgi:uncharacterized metal-binding protein